MGIPFYFKTIVTKHPYVLRAPNTIPRPDRLFLDYNCILHQSANKVIAVLEGLEQSALEDAIISDALDYTALIINLVNPKYLVYIAVDGCCPRAKMIQQRKRRFLSAWKASQMKRKVFSNTQQNTQWDSSCITPGTTFMAKFTHELEKFKGVLQSKYKELEIIASSCNIPGEGEHKIIDYIKEKAKINESPTSAYMDVIYGLDADLIMLSMINKHSNVFLLREKPAFDVKIHVPGEFVMLDVQKLSDSIYEHYFKSVISDKDLAIRNYVMLCAFLGNDFVPPLSYLKIKCNGIDLIIQSFLELYASTKQSPVTDTYPYIDNNVICSLIGSLASQEDACMIEVCNSYYNRTFKCGYPVTSKSEKISMELDNYPTINKFSYVIKPSHPGWRIDYYHYLFQKANTPLDIHNISKAYIEGIEWIAMYYFGNNTNDVDFMWYYPYSYSPTLLDLKNYVVSRKTPSDAAQRINNNHLNNESFHKMMSSPEFQLLMVLPPQSFSLVSKPLQRLKYDLNYGCIHYYPEEFSITTFLKYYLWECSPIIPDIDIVQLYSAYIKCKGEFK